LLTIKKKKLIEKEIYANT